MSAAAILALAGGPRSAHATAISWAADVNGSFNDNTKWNPATVPGSTDDVTISQGTTATPDTVTSSTNNTINSLVTGAHDTLSSTNGTFTVNNGGTNAGTIAIGNNTLFQLGGALSNTGAITINSSGNTTDLRVADGTKLSGGGTVTLNDQPSNLNRIWGIANSGAETLTNVDNTIQGAGSIGFSNSIEIINQSKGVINANATHSLVVTPSTNPTVTAPNGGGFVNQGLMESTNTGGLVLSSGVFNNKGGTIEAVGTGNDVFLQAGTTVSGGTLNGSGGGIVHTASGNQATLDGSSQGTLTILGAYRGDNNTTTVLDGTISNQGNLSLNSIGNTTDLHIADGTKLTGGGTITLSDVSSGLNRIFGFTNSGTETLTNVDNTIQGAGSIGVSNSIEVINQSKGVIDANATNSLVIAPTLNGSVVTPNGGGFVNQGLLEATNKGGLVLAQGQFNNSGGTIEAVGAGNDVFLQGGVTVSGGTVNGSGGGIVHTVSGQTANLDGSSTAGTLTILGTYQGDNNSATQLFGTIANKGNLLINSNGGNNADLRVADGTKLMGGGTVTLSDQASNFNRIWGVTNSGTETLTNVDNTIQGAGSIGVSNSIEVINQSGGVIDANSASNSLVIAPTVNGSVVTPNGGGFVNQGLLEATKAGGLVLAQGQFNNKTGTIEAVGAGNNVYLQGSVVVSGGTLTSSGGGVVQTTTGQQASLDGTSQGALTNSGTFQVTNNSTVFLDGTINNTGTINVAAGGNSTDLRMADGTQLTGGGTITLSDSANNRIFGAANNGIETVTNVNNTIQGAGQFGVSNSLEFINKATIDANGTNQLVIAPTTNGTLVSANKGGFVNQGLLEATNTGGLVLNGGVFNNQTGTIEAIGTGNNVYLQNSVTIAGGTVTSSGGGIVQMVAGHTATLDGSTVGALTNSGTFQVTNNSTVFLDGTIKNTGTINVAAGGNSTDLRVADGTQLTGGGTVTLSDSPNNRIFGAANNGLETLTNVDNTIQGAGQFGVSNSIAIVNGGTIDATGANALVIAPTVNGSFAAGLENQAGGVLEGSGAGGLSITQGIIDNQGTVQALNGSSVTYGPSTTNKNNVGGTLTGGIWKAISTGGGATVSITGGPVVTDAAKITVSGAGSIFQAGNGSTFTPLEVSLTTIASSGELHVLDNRNYTTTNDIGNSGLLDLGGGVFASHSLTNTSTGTVSGFGTITPVLGQLSNSGLVHATGGTLTVTPGISGSGGNVTIDSGAGLNLSLATAGSQAATLKDSGAMSLGAQSVTVFADYNNTNFGTGNSFNKHANVTTTGGQILASGTTAQTLTGNVTNGTTSSPSMNFGNVHVKSSTTLNYAVNDVGSGGPSLRGALQTSVNGGNISDGRLSGSGVTASNYGPIAQGSATGNLAVTFNATSAGALSGQTVHVANNFDNVGEQTLSIGGAAYDYANPTVNNSPIVFGNHHVKDVITQQGVSITNTVVSNAAFQEGLDAGAGAVTGGVTTNGGSFTNLAAGSTNNSAITVGIDTTTAGSKSGTVALSLTSNGAIDGLANTALSSQSVTVTGAVYNLASSNIIAPINFGVLHTGAGNVTKTLSITNTAPTGGFSEGLDSSFGSYANSGGSITPTFSGSIANLAAGATDNTSMMATISTATAGVVSGTVTVHQASDGATTSGLGITALADQGVGVSGTVNATITNLAQPTVNTTQPVNFGNVRIGTPVTPTALSITNSAPVSSFTEKLIGNVTGTTGTGITAAGGFGPPTANPELAGGQTDTTSITVGIDSSSAGAKSGNAVIDFKSDGTAFSGGTITDLGNTNVAVTGNVYRLATGSAASPAAIGATRVGAGPLTGNLSVTNTAASDGFSENLDAAISGTGGQVTASSGSVTGLAAGNTNGSGLSVTLDSASSGVKSGTATVQFKSDGTGIDGGAPVDNGSQVVTVTGKVYQTAVASVSPGPVNFGIVHKGDTVAPQSINVANTASGALTDVVTGNVGSITGASSGAFSSSGTLGTGVAAGGNSNALQIGLNTGTAGVYNGQANLALNSHDADLADVALSTAPVALEAQVNNYAHGTYLGEGGAGTLSGSGSTFKLDFGTVTESPGSLMADLGVENDAIGPADALSAVLDPGNPALPANLTLNGFNTVSDLAAGSIDNLLSVALDTSALGFFDVFVKLDLSGSNASGYDAALAGEPFLTLELTGDIVTSGPPPAPEPGSFALFGSALIGLTVVRWRRKAGGRIGSA
ncbi:MAG TPA: choice-of-anchor D domain-containing protein [Alphaproteobacteria bacterium]|nr:choice-of-anchor D domain-containing protein [Alphaproteobacteria bacterium]